VLRDIILDKGHKDKLDAVLHGNAARLLAKHGVTF
jgi:hypothetical protein